MKSNIESAKEAFCDLVKSTQSKKIILVGKTCAGKTFLKNLLHYKGFLPDVSWTTRQRRDDERPGLDYNFVDEDMFLEKIEKNFFIQYQKFGDNYYGTTKNEWRKKNVFIMTPSGVKQLGEEYRKSAFIIYLDVSYEIAHKRLDSRGWLPPQISKRINNDIEEFKDFKEYDIKIELNE